MTSCATTGVGIVTGPGHLTTATGQHQRAWRHIRATTTRFCVQTYGGRMSASLVARWRGVAPFFPRRDGTISVSFLDMAAWLCLMWGVWRRPRSGLPQLSNSVVGGGPVELPSATKLPSSSTMNPAGAPNAVPCSLSNKRATSSALVDVHSQPPATRQKSTHPLCGWFGTMRRRLGCPSVGLCRAVGEVLFRRPEARRVLLPGLGACCEPMLARNCATHTRRRVRRQQRRGCGWGLRTP